jgi:hypothetical protein
MTSYIGTLSGQIVDSYGIPGQTPLTVTIPDTATLAQIASDVAAMYDDLQPLTQGTVIGATLKLDFPKAGADPSAATGDIEKGALFNFNNATDPFATGIIVPDVAPAILNGSGLVNLSNADVTTWITWITTAHTAITVVTKGIRALTTLRDALISFRKHRKPLTRKTKEL